MEIHTVVMEKYTFSSQVVLCHLISFLIYLMFMESVDEDPASLQDVTLADMLIKYVLVSKLSMLHNVKGEKQM